MKKIITILTAVFTMMFAGICMAADGGTLNKQQAVSEVFLQAFSEQVPEYKAFTKDFGEDLKAQFNEGSYTDLQKKVKDNFGRLKEIKFYSFQRFDQADQVTYILSFSKKELVSADFVFNKQNKIIDFVLSPVQAAQQDK